ncbi:DnaK-type molecular chaperone bipA [Leptodontidium sp. 2 PMI_412]|nr:DnaK-type molecular chaperone bipA [Leptodontidium sp. 2 PMI_412]
MTAVKVSPEGNPSRAQKLASGQKPGRSNNSFNLSVPRWILLAFLGALAASCVSLVLYIQNPRNNVQLVPTTTPQPELEQPAPYCGNAYEYESEYPHVIAIEFGETYSMVGASVSGSMEIFYNDGQLQTPNYVAYTDDGVLVGHQAREQALANPKNTIFDVRRLLGRKYSKDPSLQRDIDSLPYDVIIKDDKAVIKLHINGKDKLITPEEVQAEVMKKLKTAANEYYGKEATSAVMTVPVYFDDDQRQATKDAATTAGLDVFRLVNEPTAASIGHYLNRLECTSPDCEDLVVVYNLGEKSVDVTVSSIDMGIFEILGAAGNRLIGGYDLDNALLEYAIQEFQTKMGDLDLKTAANIVERLKAQVESVEQKLSAEPQATIQVDEFSLAITQKDLESFHKDIFERSIKHIETALGMAKLQTTNISHLILTGDPNQVSKIQPFLEAFFDGKKVRSEVVSDQAVLRGAVYQAEILSGESRSDWTGAFDITGLSLGIETAGGLYTTVIPRNSVLPTRKAVNVTTIHDNQSKVVVNIIEGERPFVINDKVFGTLELADLSRRPAGELIIEVSFELDSNSVLRVTATELESGKREVFQANSDLYSRYDGVDLDAVMIDTEEHVEEDFRKRAVVDDELILENESEFGIVVVPREGEKPTRWYWNEKEGMGYKL